MSDFKDLLILFNKHAVRYLIVGGFAYSIHREFRATKDLDVFVEATPENSLRTFAALAEFGAPLAGLTAQDFASENGTWYGMGRPPARIDVLVRIDGKTFAAAWPNRKEDILFGVPVHVISREDLIENKLAAGRPQDLVDVNELRRFA